MSLDLTKMTRVTVELSLVLILMVHGVLGSEFTIKVPVGSSATVQCRTDEELKLCRWSSLCKESSNLQTVMVPYEINPNTSEKYLTFAGLQMSNAGLYGCFSKNNFNNQVTRMYRIDVIKDRDPTVVIETLGKSTVLTCGTGLDVSAASEKRWCRLDESAVCEENTIMGPGEAIGNFKVRETNNVFRLENRNLTHDTTGLYKCTLDFPDRNQTKVCKVNLQVMDSPTQLKIHHVQIWPKGGQQFEMTCPYPEEMKYGFSKYWKCDNANCPEVVKSTDDHFRSALVLTIDHITCIKIRTFQCVMKSLRSSKVSNVYRHPLMMASPTVMYFSNDRYQTAMVYSYTVLNMVCNKPYEWEFGYGGYGWSRRFPSSYNNVRGQATICKRIQGRCMDVDVLDRSHLVEFKLCVTPEDNGTVYRCQSGYSVYQINIFIKARPPPPKPRPKPTAPPSSTNSNVVIVIVVTIITLLMLSAAIVMSHCKARTFRQWSRALFRRQAPLSAVDVHATMYANAIAQYYSQQRNATVSPTATAGNFDESSTSSDDEFEELPVLQNPSRNINKDKNEYVTVKMAEPGRVPSGEQVQDEAERDEEEDITYTHVIIQPKTDQHK